MQSGNAITEGGIFGRVDAVYTSIEPPSASLSVPVDGFEVLSEDDSFLGATMVFPAVPAFLTMAAGEVLTNDETGESNAALESAQAKWCGE